MHCTAASAQCNYVIKTRTEKKRKLHDRIILETIRLPVLYCSLILLLLYYYNLLLLLQ